MANTKNLKRLSSNEARENGKKGGIKSGEVRREKKLLRQVAEAKLLELLANGKTFQECALDNLTEHVLNNLIKPTDIVKILEFLRDTAGQKPIEKQDITNNDVYVPTLYITPKDCANTDVLCEKLKNASGHRIKFISQEKCDEIDRHIKEMIGD